MTLVHTPVYFLLLNVWYLSGCPFLDGVYGFWIEYNKKKRQESRGNGTKVKASVSWVTEQKLTSILCTYIKTVHSEIRLKWNI